MAFDTKLNLTDSKFEQLSGETLNLFGNTHIHGDFIINSGGTFSILLNHGAGKVWTSDSGGTGSWQQPFTGGTWGSITGILSGQTDLQNALNGKLNSGGTAICATTAENALALCGCVPASFLLSGDTAIDSLKLGGQLPAYYLNTGSTITCAADSAKLNNKLPAYYLNTGSTSINSLALCGCIPSCFLGATTCAVDSAKLGNHLPSYYLSTGGTVACASDSAKLGGILPVGYLLSGGTAICTTSAIDSKALCGCTPNCFLGVNACAADSAKLNNKLPTYYLNTGSTVLCATCAIGAKSLCGCVPASFLLSGGTAVCATSAIDSKALCGCTPSCFLGATACASDSKCLGGYLPAYYLSTGGTVACASDSAKLGGILPSGYMLTGATYNLSSPATKCVGGVSVSDVLTGKTAFQLIQQILAPELFPTSLVAPSTSIAANPAGTFEIGYSISTLCITGTFNCGLISPQYCSSSSCRSGLANCYVFTGCQVVGSYACTTSPITKCATAYVICASQTWTVSTCFDIGVQPKGSAGTNYSTPLAANITSAASVTLIGIYPYYYGKLTSGSRPAVTNALITTGCIAKCVLNAGICTSVVFGAVGEWTWFAIPAACAARAYWCETALSRGTMATGPTDKYPDTCTLNISSGEGCWSNISYNVYMSGTVGTIGTIALSSYLI
jgi:hypothetical protein